MRLQRLDRVLATALLAATVIGAPTGARAATKTYQVTGPVTEVTADTITVQKGKEQWQLQRNADTKTAGAVKAGDKVTVTYSMTAASITVSPVAAKPAAAKGPAPAAAPAATPAATKPAPAAAKAH